MKLDLMNAARKPKTVALYLRVSTTGQTVENQRRELEEAAERHGWHIVQVFKDAGISGAKGRDKRPGLDALLKGVARKDFDLIAAWSVDRLGRSLQDLISTLGELHAKGIGLYLHQQGLDTSTPAGEAMFQMMGVFAQFERSMIRERVMAGLKRAKANGQTLGRPKVDDAVEAAARKALRSGKGIRKVARELGIGNGTVERIRAEMASAG